MLGWNLEGSYEATGYWKAGNAGDRMKGQMVLEGQMDRE